MAKNQFSSGNVYHSLMCSAMALQGQIDAANVSAWPEAIRDDQDLKAKRDHAMSLADQLVDALNGLSVALCWEGSRSDVELPTAGVVGSGPTAEAPSVPVGARVALWVGEDEVEGVVIEVGRHGMFIRVTSDDSRFTGQVQARTWADDVKLLVENGHVAIGNAAA